MRAAWLEYHDEFEGVGAHELNPRYDHVDGDDWDALLRDDVYDPRTVRTIIPALFAAQTFQRTAALTATPIRFDGADISHHQDDAGPIDWPMLRAASTGAWVATKATQSTRYVDPTFMAHRAQMGVQGFRHCLHYHWLSSTTDPVLQARHYLETVGDWFDGEGSMLDAEEHGITAAMCLEWCRAVEAETRRPASVYSGAYVAGGTIWQSTTIRTSPFGHRPMHLAAYTTEARARALPGVAAYPWDAWQYSSNGPVPGVTGRCDMNRNDNRAAYDLACGIEATPFPPPDPQPVPEIDDMQIRLLILTDSDAQFLAETTSDGRALRCRWADGSAKTQAVVMAHRAAASGKQTVFEQRGDTRGLANVYLDGPLPFGDSKHTWSGAEFAGIEATQTNLEPRVARLETQDVAINDSVGRVGQRQSIAGVALREAAAALLGD